MRLSRWLALLCSVTLHADQSSFLFYNDYFAGTDKHFTNGFALSWLDSDKNKADFNSTSGFSTFMLSIVDTIPYVDGNEYKNYVAGASLSQMMLTPKNTKVSTPQYDDIPYAGYLALSMYLFQWDSKSFKEYRVDIGVVGKESGAADLQKSFHKLIHDQVPQGWDTQLGTHYVVNPLFRYGEKSWKKDGVSGMSMDWFNHFGFQAGNFTTDAFAGTMFRFGKNYYKNFNVHYPYLREEASLLHVDKTHKGFGWSVTTGVNTELLLYSYIIDTAKNRGYHIDKNLVNASLYLGGDIYYDTHKLTFFYQAQSSYIISQKTFDIYGGLIYTYQF